MPHGHQGAITGTLQRAPARAGQGAAVRSSARRHRRSNSKMRVALRRLPGIRSPDTGLALPQPFRMKNPRRWRWLRVQPPLPPHSLDRRQRQAHARPWPLVRRRATRSPIALLRSQNHRHIVTQFPAILCAQIGEKPKDR